MKNTDMFADLSATQAAKLFAETTYPWEVLPMIKAFVRALGPTLSAEEYDHPSEEVWIHKSAVLFPNIYIMGPTIIGEGVTVGHGAIVHACTVGDYALIGMGATILDGAVIGPYAIIGAGALVPPGKVIGEGEVWVGNPAISARCRAT